jgi:hypothetical protein
MSLTAPEACETCLAGFFPCSGRCSANLRLGSGFRQGGIDRRRSLPGISLNQAHVAGVEIGQDGLRAVFSTD